MLVLEFNQRPIDVSPQLRLYRRLAMLVISLSKGCRGGTGSLQQLHFLNSLYLDEQFRETYLNFKSMGASLKLLTPGADPYLNRCVNYAIAAGLLEHKPTQQGFRVKVTDKGKAFFNALKKEHLAADIMEIAETIGLLSSKEIETAVETGIN